MTCHVSLVIPHFNESGRLTLMESGLLEFAKASKDLIIEILLVDDGSSDETLNGLKAIAGEFSSKHQIEVDRFRLRAIGLSRNSGKGAALQRGVAAAQGNRILTLDADMAARPIEILNWQKAGKLDLRTPPDNTTYIGSREHPESNVTDKGSRRIMGRVFNFITRKLSGLDLHDTQCGFKLYPAPLAKQVFESLFHLGWAHDVEVLMRLQRTGSIIESMPVSWTAIEGSKISPLSDAWKMFCALLEIRAALKKENPSK